MAKRLVTFVCDVEMDAFDPEAIREQIGNGTADIYSDSPLDDSDWE